MSCLIMCKTALNCCIHRIMTQHPRMINAALIYSSHVGVLLSVSLFDNLPFSSDPINILLAPQLKEVNHISVDKSRENGFLFTEKCRQIFIPFLHNYMLRVRIIRGFQPRNRKYVAKWTENDNEMFPIGNTQRHR